MSRRDEVRALLDEYGTTYAEQARITLRDKPSPLYQLLVLTVLFSVRTTSTRGVGRSYYEQTGISADTAGGSMAEEIRTPPEAD